jgi:peptide-methionine (S)-S-oxide reductase
VLGEFRPKFRPQEHTDKPVCELHCMLRGLTRLFFSTTTVTMAAAPISASGGGAPWQAPSSPTGLQTITFAGGCFWCVESPYSEFIGVTSAVSGYIGGSTKNPTYREVCGGETGHAEAVRVTYDPARITFPLLLDVFFDVHDPTTLNRQGNDVGTQYRSAIFYHTPEQLDAINAKIKALEDSGKVKSAIVTQVADANAHTWYPAEEYHQCYVKNNPTQGYVRAVSIPKLLKIRQLYGAHMIK